MAAPPTQLMKMLYGDRFFYILYFQQPGVAEGELDADPYDSLAKVLWGASGVRLRGARHVGRDAADGGHRLPDDDERSRRRGRSTGPEGPWLTEDDLQTYADEFAHSGFFGPISYYRNLDANFDIVKDLGPERVAMPVYFIGGTDDVVNVMDPTGVERMQNLLPDFRGSTILEGVGHWTQQEAPAAFNKPCWGSCKRCSRDVAATSLQLAEQAQHLEVQPHQGDDQGEGGEPLHALRQALLGALLDEVEVERQVHRRQAGGEDAEADAEQAGRVQEARRRHRTG